MARNASRRSRQLGVSKIFGAASQQFCLAICSKWDWQRGEGSGQGAGA